MSSSVHIVDRNYNDYMSINSKFIEKTFKDIEIKYQELRKYLKSLKESECDEKEIKHAENIMKELADLLFNNWKIIGKIEQDTESLKYDLYLNTINEYKTHVIHLLYNIKDVLKDDVNTSNCRNSTSTNESKTLFNTRRETTENDFGRRNDSLSLRPNIFLSGQIDSKHKDSKEYQIKVIDSLVQDIELQKFEREFNLFKYISQKIKKTEFVNNNYLEDKKVVKFMGLIVISLFLIFLIKKFN